MTSSEPAKAPSDIAAPLRLAITRMARRLRQEADPGLTPSQLAALATIERHGPLTPSDLARIERISRPTATGILRGLVDAGLVDRRPDPADGRSALVEIEERGRKLLNRLRSRKNAYLSRRLAGLDREELETLERAAEILERLQERDRG
jgi:DNA-binding MarR family transcriptional regulator